MRTLADVQRWKAISEVKDYEGEGDRDWVWTDIMEQRINVTVSFWIYWVVRIVSRKVVEL